MRTPRSVFRNNWTRCCGFLRRICLAICCRKDGNKISSSPEPQNRSILVGVEDLDSKKDNKIVTSKYTLLTFVPHNLAEQFRRVVNFYFLFVTIISIVIDSPVSPMTSIAPLTFMVFVTACKQGYEDWCRHRADNFINNMSVKTMKNGTIKEEKNMSIKPGTLVMVPHGCDVPADLVLLCVSESDGRCYVTTANLDGETNLKTLRVPQPFVGLSAERLPTPMKLLVPPPEADLYTFYGRLLVPGWNQIVLSTDNLMLRGSRVKNTEWALGCAVYTGKETKLALNSKFTSNKFSSCERAVNVFLIFFVVVLIIANIVSSLIKWRIDHTHPERDLYLGPSKSTFFGTIVNDFFSFLLLYYYIVPMSLYVTIETYKFFGAMFIGWDDDLKTHGRPAVANTSDLNEELGQVEVLFSDKTGTLTKNQMVFKACSIYGRIFEERDDNLFCINEGNRPANFEEEDMRFFFTILGLCHDVQTSVEQVKMLNSMLDLERRQESNFANFYRKKLKFAHSTEAVNVDGEETLSYHASSPDEKALVEAAARAGFVFIGQEGDTLRLRIDEEDKLYDKLQVIEFTSARKRMSVVVRDEEGQIWLFCKGAETAVLPLCTNIVEVKEIGRDIDNFAKLGLRTLAIAYRTVDEEEYESIVRSIEEDSEEMKDVKNLYWVLEKDLTLIGATAIEDCLQDDVAETLHKLKQAGIRTWVLTGDKVETAINVSQSCAHVLESDRKLFLVGVTTHTELDDKLTECEDVVDTRTTWRGVAIILDGTTIATILASDFIPRFIELSMKCSAVLCCRLSPLQKAEIVKYVKLSPTHPITAAIGDGANDISMIQEAHIGFGIFGREGNQAARCADYAFTDFSKLQKILLVLGHWYYQRLATLINYFLYKNLVLALMMFFFQFHSAFSTQSIYDSLFVTFYNMVYTCFPCLLLSLTEQRWPPEKLMSDPPFYKTITRNKLMEWNILFAWSFYAVFHTAVIYFFTFWAFRHDVIKSDAKTSDFWSFGAALFHLTIIVVSLELWVCAFYQTYYFILSIILSILGNITISALYSYYYWPFDGDVLGTYIRLLTSFSFWILNVIVIIVCLCTGIVLRVYTNHSWKKYLKRYKANENPRDSQLMSKISIIFSKTSFTNKSSSHEIRPGKSKTKVKKEPKKPDKSNRPTTATQH